MWPWEHLAVGYILYSVYTNVLDGSGPSGAGALIVAFATQFPDLVDKPGSWVFGVLPSGTSVAHSAFVAVPISLFVLVIARSRRRTQLGVAFALGYLSHLLGDVVYPVLLGGGPAIGAITWPLGRSEVGGSEPLFPMIARFWSSYVEFLVSPAGVGYVVLEVTVLTLAVGLWVRDGRPGVDTLRQVGYRVFHR